MPKNVDSLTPPDPTLLLEAAAGTLESIREVAVRFVGAAALGGDTEPARRVAVLAERMRAAVGSILDACDVVLEPDTAEPAERASEQEAPLRSEQPTEHSTTREAAEPEQKTGYPLAETVNKFVFGRALPTVEVGTIVNHISPGVRMQPGEYRALILYLNNHPLFTHEGSGTYRVHRPRTHTMPTPATAPLPATLGAKPSEERVEEAEPTGEVDKDRQVFALVEKFAWTRGAFSADDLRADPALNELLTKDELRTIGNRLVAWRKQIVARIVAAGGDATWLASTVAGKKKFTLAFYGVAPDISRLEAAETPPPPAKEPAAPPKPTVERRVATKTLPEPEVADVASAEVVPERYAFNVYSLIRPENVVTSLSDADRADIRVVAMDLFANAGAVRVSREDMIRLAVQKLRVKQEAAVTILQTMYELGIIGKSASGDAYSADPTERRWRQKSGSSEPQVTEKAKKEDLGPIGPGVGKIFDALAASKGDVLQGLRPAQIVSPGKGKTEASVSEEDVKRIARRLPSYFALREVRGRPRIALASKAVKEAVIRDRAGLETAIQAGKTFEQYLAGEE